MFKERIRVRIGRRRQILRRLAASTSAHTDSLDRSPPAGAAETARRSTGNAATHDPIANPSDTTAASVVILRFQSWRKPKRTSASSESIQTPAHCSRVTSAIREHCQIRAVPISARLPETHLVPHGQQRPSADDSVARRSIRSLRRNIFSQRLEDAHASLPSARMIPSMVATIFCQRS